MSSSEDVTGLLIKWCDGDQTALERLIPLVERELRQRAHRYMSRENAGHTLQTTALINEAFIGLMDQRRVQSRDGCDRYGRGYAMILE